MAGDARLLAGLVTSLIGREIIGPAIHCVALMAGPAFMADPRLKAATRGFADGEAPYMIPLAGELPNVHREMELLVRLAGFTPLEALTAATLGGAMAIGIPDRIGSVEAGKDADLVLLEADPTADIRNTRRIAAVFRAGRRIR